ncbi:MAG: hypothetical protein R2806_15290 [Saprospiraceae bacterium]
MRNYIIIMWGSLLWVTGCQTLEFPEPQVPDPVFYVKGTINGTPWQLAAGEDAYYLDTEFRRDSARVPVLVSTLHPDNCSGLCNNSFQMQIRHVEVSATGAIDINALFQANADKQFLDNSQVDSLQFQFKSLGQCRGLASSALVHWSLGDRKIQGEEATFVLPDKATDIDYLVQDAEGTLAVQMTQPLLLDASADSSNRQSLKVDLIQDGRAIVIQISDTRDFSILWSPAGSDGKKLVVKEPLNTRVSAEIKWQNGQTGRVIIKLPPDNNLPADICQAGYTYRLTRSLPRVNPLQLNTIDLYYMNEQGKLFSTRFTRQIEASFKIIDHEVYKKNQAGQSTQKVYFLLNCVMTDEFRTEKLQLQDVEGVFAFAYPD